jgi:hypothetical protein
VNETLLWDLAETARQLGALARAWSWNRTNSDTGTWSPSRSFKEVMEITCGSRIIPAAPTIRDLFTVDLPARLIHLEAKHTKVGNWPVRQIGLERRLSAARKEGGLGKREPLPRQVPVAVEISGGCDIEQSLLAKSAEIVLWILS